MSTVHDYSENVLGLKDLITVFNPKPYPITISSLGHTLGGRETAVVLRIDPYVVKALEIGDVILVPEAESPAPSKPAKKTKTVVETEVVSPDPSATADETGETPSEALS